MGIQPESAQGVVETDASLEQANPDERTLVPFTPPSSVLVKDPTA